MFRQIAGALIGNKNPALGGLITGETQRQRTIQPLQQEYNLIGGQIAATRAADSQDVENRLKGAQTTQAIDRGKLAVAQANKQETPTDKLLHQGYDANGNAQALMQRPDNSTYVVPIPNMMNPQVEKPDPVAKPSDEDKAVTDYESAHGLPDSPGNRDRARSVLKTRDRPPSQASTENSMKPVMAYDSAGKAHIVPQSEALDPKNGYTNPIQASDKDLNDANTHTKVLNDVQTKLNDVVDARGALDQGEGQRAIISKVLSHSEPGVINDFINSTAMKNATPQTKAYIKTVQSLKESSLGIPKELTGGSRQSDISANALFQTLPSGQSVDSNYALDQAKSMQGNIDRLREPVPQVRGTSVVPAHPDLKGGSGSKAASGTPPASMLKEGIHTTFKNGQTWTLQNGQPTQVNQ